VKLSPGSWQLIALALAAVIVLPRPGVGPANIAYDGLAHLAWSKDLASASHFYSPGFPAFLSTLTLGSPLVGAFRIGPLILLSAFFIQISSLATLLGWSRAGLAGCAALLSMPGLHRMLDPALPETMAYVLIVATWVEVQAHAKGGRQSISWLVFFSFALVFTHVSTLEIIHLVTLLGVLLLTPNRRTIQRLKSLGGVLVAITAGVFLVPLLRSIVLGGGILLLSGQPSNLTPFSVKQTGGNWGPSFDLALVSSLLLLVTLERRTLRPLARILPFFCGAVLLLSPMLLRSVDVRIQAQLFNSRLIIASGLFMVMAWVGLLAIIHDSRPRWAVGVALLPVVGLAYRFWLDPLSLFLFAFAAISVVLVIRNQPRLPRSRAFLLVALVLVAVSGRLVAWYPSDPSWIRALRTLDPKDGVVLTHFPAFNQVSARTDFPLELGIAGSDAALPLHAITALPELREHLRWCGNSAGEDRAALVDWINRRKESEILILVDRSIEKAWSNYRKSWSRKRQTSSENVSPVLISHPCPDSTPERLARIYSVLDSLDLSRIFYRDEDCTIYQVIPSE
jgi:hypothetical protein